MTDDEWRPPTADGRVLPPPPAREPTCVHDPDNRHYMSACLTCQHSEELRRWGLHWQAWLAENPNSPEARLVAQLDAHGWRRVVGGDT